MNEHESNEINATSGQGSPNKRRDHGQNGEANQNPAERPYGDAGNLYEIPRIRPDDPPMRNWWIDDEPQQDGSGSQQNS